MWVNAKHDFSTHETIVDEAETNQADRNGGGNRFGLGWEIYNQLVWEKFAMNVSVEKVKVVTVPPVYLRVLFFNRMTALHLTFELSSC